MSCFLPHRILLFVRSLSVSIVCLLDVTLNGAPCQGLHPPLHAKDCFSGFQRRVGL